MKPAPFTYHAPGSLAEAVALLAAAGHDGKVLAGGQSLIPILNMRLASPSHLVDINGLPDLGQIEVTADCVRVGALVRHAELLADDAAAAAQPLLRQALRNVAHPAIRNRGTTVGSIAHADAAGEMPAIAALTEAVMEITGPGGSREVAAADFFVGALETVLEPDEILTHVRFGRFPEGTRTAFLESARRHGDYAMAGVAVAVAPEWTRAAYVSVTDVPGVVDLTEAIASDDPAALDAAIDAHIDPLDDIHASADYRGLLARELTRRALQEATA